MPKMCLLASQEQQKEAEELVLKKILAEKMDIKYVIYSIIIYCFCIALYVISMEINLRHR